MKILLTGMSARSVGSTKVRYDYIAFPAMLRDGLQRAGHEVDMRVVKPGEDLSEYDRALVHVGWASSLSSMHVHEAALALGDLGDRALIYYDDWRSSPHDDLFNHIKLDKGWKRHTERFRPEEYSRLTPAQRDRVREVLVSIIDPRGCPWPVLAQFYDWGDPEVFKADGKQAQLVADVIGLDPTGMVPIPEFTVAQERERRWVFAVLREHDRWKVSLGATWPIAQYGGVKKGPGGTRPGFGADVISEKLVLQAYADSRGMLVAPYKFLDGSGWWRSRFTLAFAAGAIAHVSAPKDAELLGPSFQNELADIESASDYELDALAARQAARFREFSWTADQFVKRLDAAVREKR